MWEATLLGVSVAALISVAFVGGCFCGSWVQRSIGYVIRTRAEKELLDSAAQREEKSYEHRRMADFQARRTKGAEEAMDNVGRNEVPNPLGPHMPSPEDLDEILGASSTTDFTKGLATERMRAAGGSGG